MRCASVVQTLRHGQQSSKCSTYSCISRLLQCLSCTRLFCNRTSLLTTASSPRACFMRTQPLLLLPLLFVIAVVSQQPIIGPFTPDGQRSITIELKHPSSPEHPQEKHHHHNLHSCRHTHSTEIRSNFRSDIRRLKCNQFSILGRFQQVMSLPAFIMNINSTGLHNATATRLRLHFLRCRMLVNSFNVLKNPFHRRLFETRGHEAIVKDGSPTLADPHRDVFGLKMQLYLGSEFEMCAPPCKHPLRP